ncbi:formin-like protein 18 [Sagmatias obliquidens]|uniref:formin-like protein 18 n=1 Tax=Sagmatias obliquidens TaxID=3371155 RepID=UPI000F44082D|nr:formin-like protein 18 [Lagenorhynchus obliquidens]
MVNLRHLQQPITGPRRKCLESLAGAGGSQPSPESGARQPTGPAATQATMASLELRAPGGRSLAGLAGPKPGLLLALLAVLALAGAAAPPARLLALLSSGRGALHRKALDSLLNTLAVRVRCADGPCGKVTAPPDGSPAPARAPPRGPAAKGSGKLQEAGRVQWPGARALPAGPSPPSPTPHSDPPALPVGGTVACRDPRLRDPRAAPPPPHQPPGQQSGSGSRKKPP